MLRISKLADYATVIMNYLAHHPEHWFSATAVSRQVHIAVPTVSKILKILLDSGLVISMRGAGGGYRLARQPEKITLAQVISAMEGTPALTECSQAAGTCAQDTVCALRHNWRVINRVILTALENLTLADMAKPLHLQWSSLCKINQAT